MKWYGNVSNRIEENRNYKENKLIEVGDDITKYLWSDRDCYYVTKVIDQKHIFVKRYHVCADHDKATGMGHQDWLYFKTQKEEDEYLHKYFENHLVRDEYEDEHEIELVFRYKKWREVYEVELIDGTKEKRNEPFGNISFGVRSYYYDWEF